MIKKKSVKKEKRKEPLQILTPASKKKAESQKQDLKLVQQTLRGDQKAFELLMKKYKFTLSHVLFNVVHNKDEVDDIIQEVFVNVYKALKNYKQEFTFFSWIYKIAINKGIDHIRKKKLATVSINKPIMTKNSEYYFEIPDSTYEPDKEIILKERSALLNEAIGKLPKKYQKVIIMRHQHEKEYDEIAKELKLPLGTVKVHIFRARELLYKYLRDRIKHY